MVFLEYDPDQPPTVEDGSGRLLVKLASQPEGEMLTLQADAVVLSAGIEPSAGSSKVAHLLKVPVATGGFFLEAHQKLKPPNLNWLSL